MFGDSLLVTSIRDIAWTSTEPWVTAAALTAFLAIHAFVTLPALEAMVSRILRGAGQLPQVHKTETLSPRDREPLMGLAIGAPLYLGGFLGTLRLLLPETANDRIAGSLMPADGAFGAGDLSVMIALALIACACLAPIQLARVRQRSILGALVMGPALIAGALTAASLGVILGPLALIPVALCPTGPGWAAESFRVLMTVFRPGAARQPARA